MDLNFWMLIGAYFLGSIPFGLLVCRWVGGIDVRTVGSGNIGASNVSRACGPAWGRVTLILDAAKSALPVALVLEQSGEWAPAVGLAAIVGHCWPVWLGFRGGKGVATTAGVMLVLAPVSTLAAVLVWMGVYGVSRVSALASLTACVALLAAVGLHDPEYMSLGVAAVSIVLLRHRENMGRLLSGREFRSKL